MAGVCLLIPQPDLLFWSDTSDQGWGAHLLDHFASDLWSQEEKQLFINIQELRAIRLCIQEFQHLVKGLTVGVFANNTTALAYVRKQGGTMSAALNSEAQSLLRWTDSLNVVLLPQFVMESYNVVADSSSRRNQVIGSEWTLVQEVMDELLRRWPANVDLFATSLNYRIPVYFSSISDPIPAGSDAFLQSWDDLSAYEFPPFALIREVIRKLHLSECLSNTDCSLVASEGVVPGPSGVGNRTTLSASPSPEPIASISLSAAPSSTSRASASQVATVEQFAREVGVSREVAQQLAQCHRASSQRHYQHPCKYEKVMRSDRIGTRESSEVSPVSRSQGIEENENLEYSFLGFTQEN